LIPARSCCQLAELTGIFYATRGRLIKTGNGQAAYFSLLRNTVARKVVRLSRSLAQIEAKYHAVRTAKRTAFFIELPLPAELEPAFLTPAARALPPKPCDRKNFFRGFFLGCGSVNAPSTRYHLELVAPTLGWATVLLCLLHEAQVRAGVVERAGQHVVYVKDADGIVRCLQLMGGNRAVMEFENVRVVRDVRAQVNRRINFETANIDKTIGSALRAGPGDAAALAAGDGPLAAGQPGAQPLRAGRPDEPLQVCRQPSPAPPGGDRRGRRRGQQDGELRPARGPDSLTL